MKRLATRSVAGWCVEIVWGISPFTVFGSDCLWQLADFQVLTFKTDKCGKMSLLFSKDIQQTAHGESSCYCSFMRSVQSSGQPGQVSTRCKTPNFDSNHSDTFFSVLVFLQSWHKQIPNKHHINTVSTSHISHIYITLTRNAADHIITQSMLTRRHLFQSIVRAGKMLSLTRTRTFSVCGLLNVLWKAPFRLSTVSWMIETKPINFFFCEYSEMLLTAHRLWCPCNIFSFFLKGI